MSSFQKLVRIAFMLALPIGVARADVLLLYNDNLIEGAVVGLEKHYAVRDDRGNVRYVPRTQVAYRCLNPFEAYRWKRRQVKSNDVKGHIRLAQWCLTNNMPSEATDQLLHLKSIAPNHTALSSIERQLRNFGRSSELSVLPASFRQSKSISKSRSRPIPNEILADFKRTVQPVLINRCGQLACHGSASKTNFVLQVHRNRVYGREMTQQNLNTVASLLDPEDLAHSRFFEFARKRHGPMKRAAIHSHEFEIYQRLLAWARSVVEERNDNSLDDSLQIDSNAHESFVPTPARTMLDDLKNKQRNDQGEADSNIRRASPTTDGHLERETSDVTKDLPERSATPLDPHPFNQRYHGLSDADGQPRP